MAQNTDVRAGDLVTVCGSIEVSMVPKAKMGGSPPPIIKVIVLGLGRQIIEQYAWNLND